MNRRPNNRTPFIYVATPWGPIGGGMYKVADYLIQAQSPSASATSASAELRGMDTRGNGSAVMSMVFLLRAMWLVAMGKLSGQLVGVHVNMAERLSVFRKGVLITFCRLLGVPVVLHLHAAQLPQFYQQLPSVFKTMLRWVFSLPSVCIVLGASAKKFVIQELRVPESKVEIVINGVPEPSVTRRVSLAGSIQNVLFLGNLTERKGVSDLLKALKMTGLDETQVSVCLAGGGDVAAYQAKAGALGVDSMVQFEGWADQTKVARLLANADILILPSYDEGLPLVILEALANAVAVICTPVGEIPNVLTDGKNVIFATPGDIKGIADCLRCLIEQPSLRQKLESNGREIYETTFSITKFFEKIAAIHLRCFGRCACKQKFSESQAQPPLANYGSV